MRFPALAWTAINYKVCIPFAEIDSIYHFILKRFHYANILQKHFLVFLEGQQGTQIMRFRSMSESKAKVLSFNKERQTWLLSTIL